MLLAFPGLSPREARAMSLRDALDLIDGRAELLEWAASHRPDEATGGGGAVREASWDELTPFLARG